MRGMTFTAVALFAGSFASAILAAQSSTQVSPSAINLAAFGLEVTIHVEVPYSEIASVQASVIDSDEVYSSLPIETTSADSQGHLVIKIDWETFIQDPTNELSTGDALFRVWGVDTDGEPFEGEDAARIIDVTGRS